LIASARRATALTGQSADRALAPFDRRRPGGFAYFGSLMAKATLENSSEDVTATVNRVAQVR
jgi:hypothetical protein